MSMQRKNSTALLSLILLIAVVALPGCGGSGGGGNTTFIEEDSATPPSAQADSYTWIGNSRLSVAATTGLLANDPAGAVIATFDAVSSAGGTVAVDPATGSFTYDPPVQLQNSADTFTYTLAGSSTPTTVTISLQERVWYVRNNAVGDNLGNDQSPFRTLAQAEAASDANDIIFVFAGNGTDLGQNLGIDLKTGQKLVGEAAGLDFQGTTLVAPGSIPPRVSNSGLAVPGAIPVVLLATGNEVAGLNLHAGFNEAILALDGSGFVLQDNLITFDAINGREGMRLLNVTGSNLVTANDINGALRAGIKVTNSENQAGAQVGPTVVTGTLTITRNSIATAAREGIAVSLAGAGTQQSIEILNNRITGSSIEGIDIDALAGAAITALVSGNIVHTSTAEGVRLVADEASLASFVANNDLANNDGPFDFVAATQSATAVKCLDLINNVNSNTLPNTTFQVNAAAGSTFNFFEMTAPTNVFSGINDTLAVRGDPVTNRPFVPTNPDRTCFPLGGASLFVTNCGACHTGNSLGSGTVFDITNATSLNIRSRLVSSFAEYALMQQRVNLTAEEIDAIARALSTAP